MDLASEPTKIKEKKLIMKSETIRYLTISPLQDPVTWYGINYAGTQMTLVGLPKQWKVGLDWYEFLCFGSPTASIYSVPCDRILQRAYIISYYLPKPKVEVNN